MDNLKFVSDDGARFTSINQRNSEYFIGWYIWNVTTCVVVGWVTFWGYLDSWLQIFYSETFGGFFMTCSCRGSLWCCVLSLISPFFFFSHTSFLYLEPPTTVTACCPTVIRTKQEVLSNYVTIKKESKTLCSRAFDNNMIVCCSWSN